MSLNVYRFTMYVYSEYVFHISSYADSDARLLDYLFKTSCRFTTATPQFRCAASNPGLDLLKLGCVTSPSSSYVRRSFGTPARVGGLYLCHPAQTRGSIGRPRGGGIGYPRRQTCTRTRKTRDPSSLLIAKPRIAFTSLTVASLTDGVRMHTSDALFLVYFGRSVVDPAQCAIPVQNSEWSSSKAGFGRARFQIRRSGRGEWI